MTTYDYSTHVPAWDDVRGNLFAAKLRGVSDPTFSVVPGGTNCRAWDFAVGNEVYITFQLPHSYQEGTDLHFHLHVMTDDASYATREAQFQADIATVHSGGSFTEVSPTATWSPAAQSAEEFLEFTPIVGTPYKASSLLLVRLSRIAASGTELSSCFVLDADVHIQKDSAGSRQEYTK